ncbi:MAG TPA: tetratricopeptide repeat protein [Ktedonobacteraceae bacterium]
MMSSPLEPDKTGTGSILRVVLSYAHEDESLKEALTAHLASLEREGLISSWHEGKITPGDDWEKSLYEHLMQAEIILLLISSDFIKSDYCYLVLVPLALKRHEKKEARTIPILLRPAVIRDLAIGKLQTLPANGQPLTQQEDQDQALAQITESLRTMIKASLAQIINEPFTARETARKGLLSLRLLPQRNAFFASRGTLFSRLHRTFASAHNICIQTLYGLGGCGKTQVALEYAHSPHAKDYQALFWIAAGPQRDLLSHFLTIAHVLHLPEMPESDQKQTVASIIRWLEEHERWLLIFDDIEEWAEVEPFLPETGQGHVLITSRALMTGNIAASYQLDAMSDQEGALFLLRQARLIPLHASQKSLEETQAEQARAISRRLSGLPLALAQAAAYLETNKIDLAAYLSLYEQNQIRLLSRRGQSGSAQTDHPESVMTTISLALAKVEQVSAPAALLARLCAFFHRDTIPEELLRTAALLLSPDEPAPFFDTFAFNDTVTRLLVCSLLRREGRNVSVHLLVQDVLRAEMPAEQQRRFAEAALRTLCRIFPSGEPSTWTECRYYLSHALVCLDYAEQWQMLFEEAAHLAGQAGYYLAGQGRHAEAQKLYERGLQLLDQQEEQLTTAYLLNHLGNLHLTLEQFTAAENPLQRGLAIRERLLEAPHADIAQSLNSLAGVADHQQAYPQAAALYQQALAMQQALIPQPIETAQTMNNLGLLADKQADLARAASFYHQALAFLESHAEANPLIVTTLLHNLARVQRLNNNLDEAQARAQRALAICEAQLGAEHGQTAITLNGLALLYSMQGKDTEAEPLFTRAINIWEKIFGQDYSRHSAALAGLAQIFLRQGRLAEAEARLRRALQIQEKTEVRKNIDLWPVAAQLALRYEESAANAQAESIYRLLLETRQRRLGANHVDLLPVLDAYGAFLSRAGRAEEAEIYSAQAARLRSQQTDQGPS